MIVVVPILKHSSIKQPITGFFLLIIGSCLDFFEVGYLRTQWHLFRSDLGLIRLEELDSQFIFRYSQVKFDYSSDYSAIHMSNSITGLIICSQLFVLSWKEIIKCVVSEFLVFVLGVHSYLFDSAINRRRFFSVFVQEFTVEHLARWYLSLFTLFYNCFIWTNTTFWFYIWFFVWLSKINFFTWWWTKKTMFKSWGSFDK